MVFHTTDIGKYGVGLSMLLQQRQIFRYRQRRHRKDDKVRSSDNLLGTACAGQSTLISRGVKGLCVGICSKDV